MADLNMTTKKAVFKKWWFWLIVIIIIAAIGGAGNKPTEKATDASTDSHNQELKEASQILDSYIKIYSPSKASALSFMEGKTSATIDGKVVENKFSKEIAQETVNNIPDATWDENAVIQAKQWKEASEWTEDEVVHDLQSNGFTAEQIKNALAQMKQ